MWQVLVLHRLARETSISVLALLKWCLTGRFPGNFKSVWKRSLSEDLKWLRKLWRLTRTRFCTGYGAVGRTRTDKTNPTIYFIEELYKTMVFPFVLFFLPLHYAWVSTFFLLFWPDVVYLNFMYRNDLVTCLRYNKVTVKLTDTDTTMCKCFPWITTEVIYFCIF